MPPLLPAVLAGAALYGAFLWARRQLAADAQRAAELKRNAGTAGDGPRDLGTLELDRETGIYRPRGGSGAV